MQEMPGQDWPSALRLERAVDEEDDRSRAARAAAVLQALVAHADLDALYLWERGAWGAQVDLSEEGLLALLASRPVATGEDGEPRPEYGVDLTLAGRVGRSVTLVHLDVGDRQVGDGVRVNLPLDPDRCAAALRACVRAYSPRFGCLACPAARALREREAGEREAGDHIFEDEMLHWRTYFGPGGREGTVDLDAAGDLEGVWVRSLHEGSELSLGKRWESVERLCELQRTAEPVVLCGGSLRYTSSTPEELGIEMPPGDPDLIRAGADSLGAAGDAMAELAECLRDPEAVAVEEWLRLSMRFAVTERDLAAAAASSERAYGPDMARAFASMIERMMPQVVGARRTAEQCLAIARGLRG